MLSYSSLRELQKREAESAAIVSVGEDFYREVSELLEGKKKEAIGGDSILALREYENIKKMASFIQAKREEKLVLMAVRGEVSLNGLAREEKELLSQLSESITIYRKSVNGLLDKHGEKAQPHSHKRVKLLRDIEPYKGFDNNIYGPFKKGEEQELPVEEANWLLKAKVAESL